eukprot:3172738-Heterocapsa_arctica.AAC.1
MLAPNTVPNVPNVFRTLLCCERSGQVCRAVPNKSVERVLGAHNWPLKLRCCLTIFAVCEDFDGDSDDVPNNVPNVPSKLCPTDVLSQH